MATVKTKTTTKKTTTVSKQVDTKNLEKGVNDLRNLVNSHICNINKKNRWSIDLYTKEEINTFVKKHNLETILIYLGKYHDLAIQEAIDANHHAYLDKKDNERGTMQPKTVQQEYQERLQSEMDSMKKDMAKLTKIVNKALKKGGEN